MNKYDKRHIANVRRYQRQVDAIYKEAVEQAALRSAGLPVPDDYIFTFDDFPALKMQIDALMSSMQADLELTMTNGIRAEWDLANAKNDALVSSALGQAAGLARYHRTHEDALSAFLARKERGLNLSDRVWRYTNQFKGELEMGLDLGIREGMDAASMARQLKQYLQFPDMLFRRVRDEHGVLHLSKRAAEFHPGQGVYRSSYKNARRLAATETNIAYRTSDHERWKDLDFIVGIEISLSNNHTCLNSKGQPVPFFDICDELQGKYPKEFKFVGWHPHCRCIATPILKTKAELDADDERIKRGEEPIDPNESENSVKELPDQFKTWMDDNAERIENAKSTPYFLADNEALIRNYQTAETAIIENEDVKPRELGELRDHFAVGEDWGDNVDERANEFGLLEFNQKVEDILQEHGVQLGMGDIETFSDEYWTFTIKSAIDGDFKLTRSFYCYPEGIEVYHDLFKLSEDLQGKGISKDVFKALYEQYQKMDVSFIKLQANLDVGGYTWAKYGFSADSKAFAISAIEKCGIPDVVDAAKSLIDEYYSKNGLKDSAPFPMRIIAEQPWGKKALLGSAWEGTLDFSNKEQMAYFEKYLYKK